MRLVPGGADVWTFALVRWWCVARRGIQCAGSLIQPLSRVLVGQFGFALVPRVGAGLVILAAASAGGL